MAPDHKPPHLDPMTPTEVTDLLKSTMHGALPNGALPMDTTRHVLATLAAWAPIVAATVEECSKLRTAPMRDAHDSLVRLGEVVRGNLPGSSSEVG